LGLNLWLFVMQLLVIRDGVPIATFGPFRITERGLTVATTVAFRQSVFLALAIGFVQTTNARDLGAGLHHQARLPYWFVLMLTITLSYITKFEHASVEVREALLARGLAARNSGWMRPRQAVFFLRLLLYRGFVEGQTLALSLDARGFRMR